MTSAIPSGENTRERSPGLMPAWEPGQSGNPAGRPKGSRNKLTEQFVADLHADWEENGVAVIKTVRTERPTEYLKVVAGVITKDVAVTVRDYDELSDDELAEQFAAASARLSQRYRLGGGDGEAGREAPLPN